MHRLILLLILLLEVAAPVEQEVDVAAELVRTEQARNRLLILNLLLLCVRLIECCGCVWGRRKAAEGEASGSLKINSWHLVLDPDFCINLDQN